MFDELCHLIFQRARIVRIEQHEVAHRIGHRHRKVTAAIDDLAVAQVEQDAQRLPVPASQHPGKLTDRLRPLYALPDLQEAPGRRAHHVFRNLPGQRAEMLGEPAGAAEHALRPVNVDRGHRAADDTPEIAGETLPQGHADFHPTTHQRGHAAG